MAFRLFVEEQPGRRRAAGRGRSASMTTRRTSTTTLADALHLQLTPRLLKRPRRGAGRTDDGGDEAGSGRRRAPSRRTTVGGEGGPAVRRLIDARGCVEEA